MSRSVLYVGVTDPDLLLILQQCKYLDGLRLFQKSEMWSRDGNVRFIIVFAV
jgi:hypothetical protein